MRSFVSTLTIILLAARLAWAGHQDITPYLLNNKIATGGHDDLDPSGLSDNIQQRVFGYDFGEDPDDPNIIGDPGFNNGAFAVGLYPNDGRLPAGTTLRFEMLTNLQYWNGVGAVLFGAPPASVQLGIRRGSSTLLIDGVGNSATLSTIGTTSPFVPAASPLPEDPGGRLHQHLESQLIYTDGTLAALPNAPNGAYLIGLRLTMPDAGVTPSDSMFIVYNNGLLEVVHDRAIEWVEEHLLVTVPEPASGLLLAIGLLAAVLAPRWIRRTARQ